jgi:acetate kinase
MVKDHYLHLIKDQELTIVVRLIISNTNMKNSSMALIQDTAAVEMYGTTNLHPLHNKKVSIQLTCIQQTMVWFPLLENNPSLDTGILLQTKIPALTSGIRQRSRLKGQTMRYIVNISTLDSVSRRPYLNG